MPHIRLLDPEHGSTSLANLFGLPYVIEAKADRLTERHYITTGKEMEQKHFLYTQE